MLVMKEVEGFTVEEIGAMLGSQREHGEGPAISGAWKAGGSLSPPVARSQERRVLESIGERQARSLNWTTRPSASKASGCPKYDARLEDRLAGDSQANARVDADLEDISGLRSCRKALDDALLAGGLLRQSDAPATQPSGAFVTRVMASIREEVARRSAPETIWRPLELLASRFAIAGRGGFASAFDIPGGSRPAVSPAPVASQAEQQPRRQSQAPRRMPPPLCRNRPRSLPIRMR